VLDGYFPIVLKKEFPDGVPIKVWRGGWGWVGVGVGEGGERCKVLSGDPRYVGFLEDSFRDVGFL
jgi:hypothetical protein